MQTSPGDLDPAASLTPTTGMQPLDRRVVLSGLWTSMLFVFAYVDIFAFYRADVLRGALAGELSGAGFGIDQTFLAATTLYILVPSLMVAGCLLLPYRFSRLANLTLAVLYLVTIVGSMMGETWIYYLLGSAVEVVLLAVIATVAARWR